MQPYLPQWLAQPKLVQKRIKENLVPLQDFPGIHPKLKKKLQANAIESLFPGILTIWMITRTFFISYCFRCVSKLHLVDAQSLGDEDSFVSNWWKSGLAEYILVEVACILAVQELE